MEENELYSPSFPRILLSIIGFGFLVIILLGAGLSYTGDFFEVIIVKFFVFIFISIFLLALSSNLSVDELPNELNNLVDNILLGIVIYLFLYLFIPLLSTIFALIYLVYFVSRVDENNKILYDAARG